MMRKLFSILCLAALLFILVSGARAANSIEIEFNARVTVEVSATENIKGLIHSFLTRELRSLEDVLIVDEDPDYKLEVAAVELTSNKGQKTGVALSILILMPFDSELFTPLLEAKYKESSELITTNLYNLNKHWLRVGSDDDLRKICQKIVADFDSQHLESSRILFDQINILYNKAK
jgi:hypothetical protein